MGGKKTLFVLIDGLGDVSAGPGDDTSILNTASCPTFDFLASTGMIGLMDPVQAGLACGSDTAHLSLLGYDPLVHYRGRGAFEALGSGFDLQEGDVAFKCVFAHYDTVTGIVTKRRPSDHFAAEAEELCRALDGLQVTIANDTYTASVIYSTEHRCAIRISGTGLSDELIATDPLKDGLPLLPSRSLSLRAMRTCAVVQMFSELFQSILNRHPINVKRRNEGRLEGNIILFRGPGQKLTLAPFYETSGMRAFLIAPTCVIAGIGRTLGMDIIKVPGATGNEFSDYPAKFRAALDLLRGPDYDFGFVHIKAADEASHSWDPGKKRKILERVDSALNLVMDELRLLSPIIVITGDHTTPSFAHFDHTHHPVPFLLCDLKGSRPGPSLKFCEANCSAGRLGRFPGSSVIPLIRKFTCT